MMIQVNLQSMMHKQRIKGVNTLGFILVEQPRCLETLAFPRYTQLYLESMMHVLLYNDNASEMIEYEGMHMY